MPLKNGLKKLTFKTHNINLYFNDTSIKGFLTNLTFTKYPNMFNTYHAVPLQKKRGIDSTY